MVISVPTFGKIGEAAVVGRPSLRVPEQVDLGAVLGLTCGLHIHILFQRSTGQTLPVRCRILVCTYSKGFSFDCDLPVQSLQ